MNNYNPIAYSSGMIYFQVTTSNQILLHQEYFMVQPRILTIMNRFNIHSLTLQ